MFTNQRSKELLEIFPLDGELIDLDSSSYSCRKFLSHFSLRAYFGEGLS